MTGSTAFISDPPHLRPVTTAPLQATGAVHATTPARTRTYACPITRTPHTALPPPPAPTRHPTPRVTPHIAPTPVYRAPYPTHPHWPCLTPLRLAEATLPRRFNAPLPDTRIWFDRAVCGRRRSRRLTTATRVGLDVGCSGRDTMIVNVWTVERVTLYWTIAGETHYYGQRARLTFNMDVARDYRYPTPFVVVEHYPTLRRFRFDLKLPLDPHL